VFTQVLLICQRQGLIGREMFAIDGVKLPSNASKAKSGKRKDFLRQADKMRQALEQMLSKQRDSDAAGTELPLTQREQGKIERLKREVHKLKAERDILKKAAAYNSELTDAPLRPSGRSMGQDQGYFART